MSNWIRRMTNIDGQITPTEKAMIPVTDRGFLYGDSVYEVLRTYGGIPFMLEEHFERLENSARLIHMEISQSRELLTHEIKRTAKAAGIAKDQDVYVRFKITRGEGPIELHPKANPTTRFVILVAPLPSWNPKHYAVGMSMAIPDVYRNPVNSLDPNIKGGNYLNNIMAVMQARKRGADESLILNSEAYVTEASNSNVWFVIDDLVVTPATGNLRGLTKAGIFKACAEKGPKMVERDVHVKELSQATECFISSATREVMPVYCLELTDGTIVDFPIGGGVQTKAIHATYRQFIQEYIDSHAAESFL